MLDHELSRLLISLALLLLCALAGGHLFSALRMPRVIGEICAGLVLGPSCLGYFAPDAHAWLFRGFAEQGKVLSVFYWLGLILLMFTAGFKISTRFARGDRLLILLLILGGMILPFGFGFVASSLFDNSIGANPLAFSLVIAIAAAVTSIPVITRIFIDLDLLSSGFAQVVLSAAAIQDLILWVILSIALGLQGGQTDDPAAIATILAGTAVFAAVSMLAVPALLRVAGRTAIARSDEGSLLGYTLLACFALVSLASALQVNIIFGALLAGLVLGRMPAAKIEQVKQSISNIAIWFFVPIYFALVGLEMNLPANLDAALIFGFLAASSLVKITSVAILSRLSRITWPSALDFGITMNARGGPGIVLASLAYAAKIIDEALFVALILASILTSLIAGSWLRFRRAKVASSRVPVLNT